MGERPDETMTTLLSMITPLQRQNRPQTDYYVYKHDLDRTLLPRLDNLHKIFDEFKNYLQQIPENAPEEDRFSNITKIIEFLQSIYNVSTKI